MSSDDPEIVVPPDLLGGVWANYVDVFGDIDELTLDFASVDPRDPTRGVVVARVVASRWCILKLKQALDEGVR